MTTTSEAEALGQRGKRDFGVGDYPSALDNFRRSADTYALLDDRLNQAEQLNNAAVTLLQLGRAREALETATGTEAVFSADGDARRQGIALNNQAAALEALHRPDEAVAAYEKAAQLLSEAGEPGQQTDALKAAAAIEMRRGRVARSGMKMLGVLSANPNPSLLDRVLRALLRLIR